MERRRVSYYDDDINSLPCYRLSSRRHARWPLCTPQGPALRDKLGKIIRFGSPFSVLPPCSGRTSTSGASRRSTSFPSRRRTSSSPRLRLFSYTSVPKRFRQQAQLVLTAAPQVSLRPCPCGFGKLSPRSSTPFSFTVLRAQGIFGKPMWFLFPWQMKGPKTPQTFAPSRSCPQCTEFGRVCFSVCSSGMTPGAPPAVCGGRPSCCDQLVACGLS